MKKILSIAAVAAIVTSAFAFSTTKNTQFCVKSGNACAIIPDKLVNENGSPFKHYPRGTNQWDGTTLGCTNASPLTNCIVDIRLSDN